MPTVAVTGRFDLTDAQWAVLEPLLPRGKKPGRPVRWPKRQLIDGIRWRVRAGVPWRDVPERYGPWQSVYGLFRRWQRDGTWRRMVTALQGRADAAGLITWDVSVDSTVARAHQHAAAASRICRDAASRQADGLDPGTLVGDPAALRQGPLVTRRLDEEQRTEAARSPQGAVRIADRRGAYDLEAAARQRLAGRARGRPVRLAQPPEDSSAGDLRQARRRIREEAVIRACAGGLIAPSGTGFNGPTVF